MSTTEAVERFHQKCREQTAAKKSARRQRREAMWRADFAEKTKTTNAAEDAVSRVRGEIEEIEAKIDKIADPRGLGIDDAHEFALALHLTWGALDKAKAARDTARHASDEIHALMVRAGL
jgi:hypothetical protein